jgi:ferritin-like metal-binding protein YciE
VTSADTPARIVVPTAEVQSMAESQNQDTIKTYVGDMYSLEGHIEEALDLQLEKVKDHPKAEAAVRRFHGTVRTQRDAMKAHLDALDSGTSGTLKSAVSDLFGMAAGVIDMVRTEPASKLLRDDYTAFNLAAMGYHMLYGTSLMLNDQKTAALAERHHRAYTDMVQDINQIILSVVADELRKDGLKLNEKAMDSATETMNEDWRATAPSTSLGAMPSRGSLD